MPGGVNIRVQMLDDTIKSYDVKPSRLGSVLLQLIMNDLDVKETDYFGLSFDEGDGITFIDPLRPIGRQIKNTSNTVLSFGVKFFTPDPSQMQDEYTRYLYSLQIKRDISSGILPCSESTALEIASHIAQAEFGNWNSSECSITSYLKDIKIFPNPTQQQLEKISQLHHALIGKTPAEADYSLLDIARRLEFYGIRLYPALDAQNSHISLGVSHAGVHVFQDSKKINNFNWARIRKLSFKRKRFLIKLRNTETNNGRSKNIQDILIFVMNNRDSCKNFWRLCVEHHAFFRLEVKPQVKPKPVILSRGSSFHYNGKTQKELLELVRDGKFRKTNFERTTSKRRMNSSNVASPSPNADSYDVRLDSPSSQSNNTTPSTTFASPSSTFTDDQGSYRVNDSARSPDTSQSVTTAEVSPVSLQRSSGPELDSLHSRALPAHGSEATESVMKQEKGKPIGLQAPGDDSITNTAVLRNHSFCSDRNVLRKKGSQENDSNVESVENLLQNVSRNDRLSIISNTSNNVTFYARNKSLSFDMLRTMSCDNVAPPLPPKSRQVSNEDGSYDNLKDIGLEERERRSFGDYISDSGFSGLSDSKDPFVNDSVVNLTAPPVSMTPEVKAKIGEQKIAVGHYSVPKRPPTPPNGQFNSPRWVRTSQILDKDINEAMTQLYQAIGEVPGNDEQDRGKIVIDGTTPVVISSSEDEKGDSIPSSPNSPEEDPLLAPIKMDFDDFENMFVSTS